MAGHSKFANIKHRKAAVDGKRSKLWSKLSKAIIVAAKMGGGDPSANIRLRTAIQDAKAVSLPKDNIERAIKKGTGEIAGGDVEEILYEGYGPGGVAILCDILTDNRNRTASEVRKIFDKNGGKLGSSNCVGYLFERKGVITIAKEQASFESLMELALESGAEDVMEIDDGEYFRIITSPESYDTLLSQLEVSEIGIELSEVTRLPSTTVEVDDSTASQIVTLLEQLDDDDDVQSVSSNVELTVAQIEAAHES
jgi:YebC/PmpR family DNA-binding regulatory protein